MGGRRNVGSPAVRKGCLSVVLEEIYLVDLVFPGCSLSDCKEVATNLRSFSRAHHDKDLRKTSPENAVS